MPDFGPEGSRIESRERDSEPRSRKSKMAIAAKLLDVEHRYAYRWKGHAKGKTTRLSGNVYTPPRRKTVYVAFV